MVVADLDFLSVHLYPKTREAAQALETLRGFAGGKPAVIEETFPLEGSIMKKQGSVGQNRPREQREPQEQPAANPPKGVRRETAVKAVKLPAAARSPAGLLEENWKDSESYSVNFEFFKPNAREVWLAGSFNGWQPRATAMKKGAEGRWSAQVLLSPGRYEYRLVVDGQWQEDPMSRAFVPNQYGGLNSVVEVKPMTSRP